MSYAEALHYQQIFIGELNRKNQTFAFSQVPQIILLRVGEDTEQRV